MPHGGYGYSLDEIAIPDVVPASTRSLRLGDLSAPRPREQRVRPLYERQADGSLLSTIGADLGRATDEAAGLRQAFAPAPEMEPPPGAGGGEMVRSGGRMVPLAQVSGVGNRTDYSLADVEANARANRKIEEEYAPIYEGIERNRAAEDARMNEPLRAQARENSLRENAPASNADLNDIGVSGPMRAGQVAPAQMRRNEGREQRAFQSGEAEKQRGYGLEQARISHAATVSQESQRILAQHLARIVQGQEKMRAQGATEDEIAEETKRYVRERAPQYGDVLTRRLFPRALAQ